MARTTQHEAIERIARTLSYVEQSDRPAAVIGERLEPNLYKAMDRFVIACGGMWNSAAQAHLFAAGADPAAAIRHGIERRWHEEDNEYDFFPTQQAAADRLIDALLDEHEIRFLNDPEYAKHRITVLEPSGGHGALLDALFRRVPRDRVNLVVFEIEERNANVLAAKGYEPRREDFLLSTPTEVADYVMMNPPFNADGCRHGWLGHVRHAMAWMKASGTLATIAPRMPASLTASATVARQGNAGACGDEALVDLMADVNAHGSREELPDGSFMTGDKRLRSTTTATDLITLCKPGPGKTQPQDGWPNWHTQWTYVVVLNNDYRLLEAMLPKQRPTVAEMTRILRSHRAAWVAHHAPWVAGLVDVEQIAAHMIETQYEAEEPAIDEPWPAAVMATPQPTRAKPYQASLF